MPHDCEEVIEVACALAQIGLILGQGTFVGLVLGPQRIRRAVRGCQLRPGRFQQVGFFLPLVEKALDALFIVRRFQQRLLTNGLDKLVNIVDRSVGPPGKRDCTGYDQYV